jgi:hypothetical protein
MANTIIPVEERTLTPVEVEHLDKRRRRGQLLQVIGWQCMIVGFIITLWSGQDATYSPGWIHPMLYLDVAMFTLSASFLALGVQLKRGSNEFISY